MRGTARGAADNGVRPMRLTMFTDYSLRMLILAASKGGRNVTIEEAAGAFAISAPHLKKVVRTLTHAGFLEAQRGRSGGFRLARPPEAINLGQVIRATEPDFGLVECFREGNQCLITRLCRLPVVLNHALDAMLEVFDQYSLADLTIDPESFGGLPPVAAQGRQPQRGPRGPTAKALAG
jgi:Rrf2 family nitric oxide-sensitive transcriptional repressor